MDLCAAPGSWSQVLAKRLSDNRKLSKSINKKNTDVKIVSVDIQTMAPIEGVTIIQGDITSHETADKVIKQFQGCKAQLVVCDGAPDVTGQHDIDEYIQAQLLLAALNITTFIIEQGGTFVAKIFRGKDISLMIAQFRIFFEQVQVIKPKSSRTSSIEAFVVCKNFQLPHNHKPQMFDLLTSLEASKTTSYNDTCNDITTRINEKLDTISSDLTTTLVPFLICGDLNNL